MTARATSLLALACSLVPRAALAHPGHGTTDPGTWTHYLTEPVHVATLGAAAFVAIVGVISLRRARRRGKSRLE